MGKLELDFTHLSAAELDDQALAEISALLATSPGGRRLSAGGLIRLAAAGALLVARRPCGSYPEIVGVVAETPAGDHREVIVAVDETNARGLGKILGRRRRTRPSFASLFRRRDRAPLGFAGMARG
ncbi:MULTISPECIES: hypothetical protein [Phenylobacterium]|uniref:Uncharacterized protein n=1 Tax=Phenylobacterium koreense TaxID=266125 RepID=A0ABV2ELN9_9CAUL